MKRWTEQEMDLKDIPPINSKRLQTLICNLSIYKTVLFSLQSLQLLQPRPFVLVHTCLPP